ncbi:Alpha/Beta hydrolase protein [Stachybotrys elegans]|uniref:Alpha/Beta hydrolase protein n=1 Tax=Stachybotrys elegans TaxID=80388 RepID=A0A8K0T085_9HYPO|nr:Alpha/Beta hydrolase protein [Stachybotrys elegans]
MTDQWPDETIFKAFDIFEETYKSLGDVDLQAAIMMPKDLVPGCHPVIFLIHGGFLMTGHSLFAPFFTPSTLKLAIENSAIIISVDYRLLPSANGVADLLEDLEDAWQWSRTELPAILNRRCPGHQLDFSRLVLQGGSAGGYGAVQLALSHPEDVSAIALTYPLVDPQDHIFVTGPNEGEETVLRVPKEQMPSKEEVMAWIEEKRATVTAKAGFERGVFNAASAQYGLYYSHVFNHRHLPDHDFLPMERIKSGARLPKKIWIVHGDDDSVVYIRSSYKFIELAKQMQPDVTFRLDVAPGKDHAFDHLNKDWESFIEPGGYDFVRSAWLRP